MKFSKFSGLSAGIRRRGSLSQLLLVSAIGLVVATLLTACQLVTVDYVFLASAGTSGGQIQVFNVDSQSGALRNGAAETSSGGANPVALATTSDYANLYVANSDNNTVVHFTIANDGSLTQKDKITLAGPPTSIAVNQANTYLYVVSGSGATATLSEYALSSGAIGNLAAQQPLTIPGYTGDTVIPTGVDVLANNGAVFATIYDQSAYNPGGTTTSTANPGWIFSFAVGNGGALTPAAASPYHAGVKPSGLVSDQTNRFVYVTDYASNQLIGYSISSGNVLSFLISGPYKTGSEPSAIAIDPRAKFLYVSNSLDSTVTAYAIDLATGVPSQAINTTGSTINSTDTQPQAIAVDPALGRFVYTANYLGNSVSGFFLNPNTGQISPTEQTPYPTNLHPTAIVSIPHGNHSLQEVTP